MPGGEKNIFCLVGLTQWPIYGTIGPTTSHGATNKPLSHGENMEQSYKTRPEWNIAENRPAFGESDLSDVLAIDENQAARDVVHEFFRNYHARELTAFLSAAAYYAAAPDRERFATVRKIGRSVRNLAGALAWGLSYRLQRFAEAVDRRQLADLS